MFTKICAFLFFAEITVMAHADAHAQAAALYVQPELLEETVDQKHRSFLSAFLGETLGTLRYRTSRELMPIHDLWVPK